MEPISVIIRTLVQFVLSYGKSQKPPAGDYNQTQTRFACNISDEKLFRNACVPDANKEWRVFFVQSKHQSKDAIPRLCSG